MPVTVWELPQRGLVHTLTGAGEDPRVLVVGGEGPPLLVKDVHAWPSPGRGWWHTVTWLDRQQNAYGQTVTHVKVAGRRASSRDQAMATVQKGERLELLVLPSSGVVLSFRPLEPAR